MRKTREANNEEDKHSALPLVRGSAGEEKRSVNVPGVMPDRKYPVTASGSVCEDGEATRRLLRGGTTRSRCAFFLFAAFLLAGTLLAQEFRATRPVAAAGISVRNGQAVLRAESLERVIQFSEGNLSTTSLAVAGREMLAEPAKEFSVIITHEASNRPPRGLRPEEAGEKNYFFGGGRPPWPSEGFDSSRYNDPRPDAPRWIGPRTLEARPWNSIAGKPVAQVSTPAPGVTHLCLRVTLDK